MTIRDVMQALERNPLPRHAIPDVLRETMLGRGLIGELRGYIYRYDIANIQRTVRNKYQKAIY